VDAAKYNVFGRLDTISAIQRGAAVAKANMEPARAGDRGASHNFR